MTIKALIKKQIRWTKTLSRFNFIIIYKFNNHNKTDPFIYKD